MKQLETPYPLDVVLFASPVYWPVEARRAELFGEVAAALGLDDAGRWRCHQVECDEAAKRLAGPGEPRPWIFIALSGGVQPWMRTALATVSKLGLYNAYLPQALPDHLAGALMHANAHPANTDFFAFVRQAGTPVTWLDAPAVLEDFRCAAEAVRRLRAARFLKIGETEPWVINSCRDPKRVRERIGTEVVPVERDALYAMVDAIDASEAEREAAAWLKRTTGMDDILDADVVKASRVTAAMRRILEEREADGLSMACFAMIGDIDTTSCLALSALNDSATAIGACEGDLDAALTLFLLKAMGADFVWIANPIIHRNNAIDLAHCTAPTCACARKLDFRLMRHHESGRGVSPEVVLPDDMAASAVRIGVNAQRLVTHVGMTERRQKLPACHTQIRLKVASSETVLETLLGTHLVLSYGDFGTRMRYAAEMLGLGYDGTRREA